MSVCNDECSEVGGSVINGLCYKAGLPFAVMGCNPAPAPAPAPAPQPQVSERATEMAIHEPESHASGAISDRAQWVTRDKTPWMWYGAAAVAALVVLRTLRSV